MHTKNLQRPHSHWDLDSLFIQGKCLANGYYTRDPVNAMNHAVATHRCIYAHTYIVPRIVCPRLADLNHKGPVWLSNFPKLVSEARILVPI